MDAGRLIPGQIILGVVVAAVGVDDFVTIFLAGCKEDCNEEGRFLIRVDVLDVRGPAGRFWSGCRAVLDDVRSGFLGSVLLVLIVVVVAELPAGALVPIWVDGFILCRGLAITLRRTAVVCVDFNPPAAGRCLGSAGLAVVRQDTIWTS